MIIDENQKYPISNIALTGTIAEIGELIPYRSGNGFLRNVVLETKGVLDLVAYVPLTLFGRDAEELDQRMDIGRSMKCTGRLSSRRYVDRNGNVRWALSMSAASVELGRHEPAEPDKDGQPQEDENRPSVTADDSFMADDDDLPF